MDRRHFLKIGAAGITGSVVPFVLQDSRDCHSMLVQAGWNPDIDGIKRFVRRNRIQYIGQRTSESFKGSGKGRVVLLYKYLEKALGRIVPHDQELGDCVGQAYGIGIDALAATQIYGLGLAELFKAKASTEVVYAGSRYEVGFLEHGNARLLRFAGSFGGYAAEFVQRFGMLPRGVYGEVDLTEYNPSIARLWGKEGIPDNLEPKIKEHPVRSYALVKSYEDVRDAIVNGYPVIFCSSYGFNPNCRYHNPGGRDDMGFLTKCGRWLHAMCGVGVDDTDRPGVCLINSWGPNWVGGGTRLGQPDGSFWVEADTIDGMCSEGDSYAISGFIGFPSKKLDYRLF